MKQLPVITAICFFIIKYASFINSWPMAQQLLDGIIRWRLNLGSYAAPHSNHGHKKFFITLVIIILKKKNIYTMVLPKMNDCSFFKY